MNEVYDQYKINLTDPKGKPCCSRKNKTKYKTVKTKFSWGGVVEPTCLGNYELQNNFSTTESACFRCPSHWCVYPWLYSQCLLRAFNICPFGNRSNWFLIKRFLILSSVQRSASISISVITHTLQMQSSPIRKILEYFFNFSSQLLSSCLTFSVRWQN